MCLRYGLPVRSLLVLVCLTTAAAAAPIATLAKDIDGDGSDDKVELDTTGELRIETKETPGKVTLPIKATGAKLSGAAARGTPTIVVQTVDEAIAVQLVGGTWKQVAKTTIGCVGTDCEYRFAVDA